MHETSEKQCAPEFNLPISEVESQSEVHIEPTCNVPQTFNDLPDQTENEHKDSNDEQISEYDIHEDEIPVESRMQLRDRSQLRPPVRYDDFILMSAANVLSSGEDPKTYQEALASPEKNQWIQAMNSEMKSLKEMTTWILVPLPKGRILKVEKAKFLKLQLNEGLL